MPGGIGTLEEIIEVFTWTQLGIHQKPCGLLNVLGYYDSLVALLDRMVDQGFLKSTHARQLIAGAEAGALLDRLAEPAAGYEAKWV